MPVLNIAFYKIYDNWSHQHWIALNTLWTQWSFFQFPQTTSRLMAQKCTANIWKLMEESTLSNCFEELKHSSELGYRYMYVVHTGTIPLWSSISNSSNSSNSSCESSTWKTIDIKIELCIVLYYIILLYNILYYIILLYNFILLYYIII